MAIDIDKAIRAINDVDDAYYGWLRERLSEWVDEYIGQGIDEHDSSTFDQKDIDALRAVMEKLGSRRHLQLYGEIEEMLAIMSLTEGEKKEKNDNDELADEETSIQNLFDLEEFQSQLEAEGWMTDDEWKKFGVRQGGVCISEKVMTDIAGRWDDDRLQAFPENSKFQYTDRELPPGQVHYTITTFEWKVIMGRFSSVASMPSAVEENPSFLMWRLENGKNYVDWCKGSKLKND